MILENNLNIVLENCSTIKERKEFKEYVAEASYKTKLTQAVNTKLIEVFIAKANKSVDESIVHSRGRIESFIGYEALTQSTEILRNKRIVCKTRSGKDAIKILEDTMITLGTMGNKFQMGYKTDNTLVKSMYEAVVTALIQGTSLVISYCIDDNGKLQSSIEPMKDGVIDLLEDYLKLVSNSKVMREMDLLLAGKANNLIGGASIGAVLTILGVILAIIPILRELLYIYYNGRLKISEFLDQQAMFIEQNSTFLDNGTISGDKAIKIKNRQKQMATRLLVISDKIRIDHSSALRDADSDIREENKNWTLKSLDDDIIQGQLL